MTLAVKIISGATGSLIISAAPISYVGYTTWDKNNPTGETWLLNSGYSFNKPTFKSQDSLRHGCVENLFSNTKDKTDPKSDQKVYGCAVMSMDLYGTGIPWRNNRKDPKYINFNSEVVVRKGNEGWVINSKLDNYTNGTQTYFDYILTTYKYQDNQWKTDSKKWWSDKRTMEGSNGIYTVADSSGKAIYTANVYNEKLVIKTPKESWWDGSGWMSPSGNSKIVKQTKTDTKNWSGVWIDDAHEGGGSWIFQDIELYIKEKKNSLVFCDGGENTCFNTYQNNDKTNKYDNQNSDSWNEILKPNKTYNNDDKLKDMLTTTVKPIIDKIKSSRGTWLDLESVCNLKGIRNLNDSQKKQLSMYCTNKKTS